jgi:hypothetical protein
MMEKSNERLFVVCMPAMTQSPKPAIIRSELILRTGKKLTCCDVTCNDTLPPDLKKMNPNRHVDNKSVIEIGVVLETTLRKAEDKQLPQRACPLCEETLIKLPGILPLRVRLD